MRLLFSVNAVPATEPVLNSVATHPEFEIVSSWPEMELPLTVPPPPVVPLVPSEQAYDCAVTVNAVPDCVTTIGGEVHVIVEAPITASKVRPSRMEKSPVQFTNLAAPELVIVIFQVPATFAVGAIIAGALELPHPMAANRITRSPSLFMPAPPIFAVLRAGATRVQAKCWRGSANPVAAEMRPIYTES